MMIEIRIAIAVLGAVLCFVGVGFEITTLWSRGRARRAPPPPSEAERVINAINVLRLHRYWITIAPTALGGAVVVTRARRPLLNYLPVEHRSFTLVDALEAHRADLERE